MKNTSNTPIQSLEFDEIKANLKDFLRGQDQFKDYDFEGSALSVIIDLLAYNTHYQAFYANMASNESFIDSAVMRPSVVSLAKHLGYIPRSKKASQLITDIFMDSPSVTTQSVIAGKQFIERGTIFRGKDLNGSTVNFVTLDTYKAVRRSGRNVVQDVTLYQGYLKQISFVANTGETNNLFTIPDLNIDVDRIDVFVQRSQTDTTGSAQLWKRTTDINKLSSDTNVFFVQEGRDGLWEVYFGDGILGKIIENGNVITVRYLITAGIDGNGIGFDDSIAKRSISSSDARISSVAVKIDKDGKIQSSFGGMDKESIESIKNYSPKNYQAQDRAVTADDYKAILGKEYSNRAESFLVWGGEENSPPQYGKVFISIKPAVGNRLSFSEKNSIAKTILGERNIITITPEIVDPDMLYVNPSIVVYYDESKTTLNKEAIEARIINFVKTFNTSFLGLFQKNFRQSKFSSVIDGSSPAVISNSVSVSLTKKVEVNLNQFAPYTINFDNVLNHPIDGYPSILSSSMFGYYDATSSAINKPIVDCFMDDDGYGNIRIYKISGGASKIIVNKNTGSINYKTGIIELINFRPMYLTTGEIELNITVIPNSTDIFSRRNQIIMIDEQQILVTAVPEKTNIDNNASDSPFRSI